MVTVVVMVVVLRVVIVTMVVVVVMVVIMMMMVMMVMVIMVVGKVACYRRSSMVPVLRVLGSNATPPPLSLTTRWLWTRHHLFGPNCSNCK